MLLIKYFSQNFRIFLVILLLGFSEIGYCQSGVATVTLKNGVEISGEIIDLSNNNYIIIKAGTLELKYLWSEINKIDFTNRKLSSAPNLTPVVPKIKVNYSIPDSAFYFQLGILGINYGLDNNSDPTMAYTFDGSLGYIFNKNLSLAANLGHDFYFLYPRIGFVTYGAHYMGRLYKQPFTPTYGLITGYGSPTIHGFNGDGESIKGGLFLNPHIGMSKTFNQGSSFYFRVGYKWQFAHAEEQSSTWIDGEIVPVKDEIKMQFKRLDMRLGFLFH